jgi:hypothetical protein
MPGTAPMGDGLEHRKNDEGFPVLDANHQRIVLRFVAMAAVGSGGASNEASHAEGKTKKAGVMPAFRYSIRCFRNQYFAMTGPPNL